MELHVGFRLEIIYRDLTGKCKDTTIFRAIDRETARTLAKKAGYTLKNFKLNARCVHSSVERGMKKIVYLQRCEWYA